MEQVGDSERIRCLRSDLKWYEKKYKGIGDQRKNPGYQDHSTDKFIKNTWKNPGDLCRLNVTGRYYFEILKFLKFDHIIC